MTGTKVSFGLALLGAALLSPIGAAERGPRESDWNVDAAVSLQYEYYDVTGNRANAVYPFEGSQPSAQLDLGAEWRLTPWRSLRVRVLGLLNDSDYRSPYDGVVPERLGLSYQDGEAAIPWRIELGDSLAYFTQRTIERPIKGLQLELQAPLGGERRLSIQALSGGYLETWRGFELNRDWSTGFSLLYTDPTLGDWTAHFLETNRSIDPRIGGPEHDQRLYGLAAAKQFEAGRQRITLEGEVNRIEDRERLEGGGRAPKVADEGWFAQLRGHGRSPLSFRLRFEDFGPGYRPTASPITIPDRRSGEAHVGYRLGGGLELRGRLQRFRDRRTSFDPLDTTTAGASLSGPLFGGGARGFHTFAEFYLQDKESRTLVSDQRIATLNVDLHRSVGTFSPRVTLFWQNLDDRTPLDDDRKTTQAQIRGDTRFRLGSLRASFGPGVLYRRIRGQARDTNDWMPTATFQLRSGVHTLEAAVDLERQDRQLRDGVDVETLGYRFLYRLAGRRDFIDLELQARRREPDPGEKTSNYRASLLYTHRFSLAERRRETAPRSRRAPMLAPVSGPLNLAALLPGFPPAALEARLEQGGAKNPARSGGLVVYEHRLLDEVDARQRIVLVERGGEVVKTALVIDPPRGAGGGEFLETYERVRKALLDRHGKPDNDYAQGEPGSDLFRELNRGGYVRLTEWMLDGGVLRLGVPRRIDGQVRIEAQVADDFPPVRDTLWSIEDLK